MMKRTILIVLLTACGDNMSEPEGPDAGIVIDASVDAAAPTVSGASCTVNGTAPALGGPGFPADVCISTVTVHITCAPGVPTTHDEIIFGWAKLLAQPPSDFGFVDTVYRCNTSVSAVFVVPCVSEITVAARFQDPLIGGDIHNNEAEPGVFCDAPSGS